jgi:hypothetical protein
MAGAEHRVSLPERYRVTRRIASGGMATVWAAEDQLLRRLVAVKVLAPQIGADPSARVRFEREARTAARVSDHPHVVTIYDIGEHEGNAFIVMEYLAGGTVADRLRDGTPIPRSEAVRWLDEAAAALDAAHAQGIVHRDVKPANLLLDDRGRLAVGDFGIARLATDVGLTTTGQVLGTAAYLSPEQAMGEPATPASDRYSLAVVAHELLTGTRPFRGEHAAAQARQHVEAPPPRATESAPDLPAAVDPVIARGLAKAPDARWPSAAAFVSALREGLGGVAPPPTAATVAMGAGAQAAPPPSARTPRPAPPAPPVARTRRRLPAWAAALAAAAVAGIVLAILLASGGDGDGERVATRTAQPPARTARPSGPAMTTTTPAGANAAQLNDQGFALLQGGNYRTAIDTLRRAVEAGEASACPRPPPAGLPRELRVSALQPSARVPAGGRAEPGDSAT